MLKKVLLAFAGLVAILIVVIAMQPADFQVSRSTTIEAPPTTVYPLISDFHHWDRWSPWAKLDPNMKTMYSGSSEGRGAVYEWSGDKNVGEGRMTIVEAHYPSMIGIDLEFIEPFASRSRTDFELQDGGDRTLVSWTMTGKNNFLSKGFSLFMGGMDKAIGPDFEKGLSQLKAAAEGRG